MDVSVDIESTANGCTYQTETEKGPEQENWRALFFKVGLHWLQGGFT